MYAHTCKIWISTVLEGTYFRSNRIELNVKDKMIISHFYQNEMAVTKKATGCLRMVKMDIFLLSNKRLSFS